MNKYEYEFMTGKWEGPKGAAFNQCYSFCRRQGWIMGWSDHGEPIPSATGIAAMNNFKKGNSK